MVEGVWPATAVNEWKLTANYANIESIAIQNNFTGNFNSSGMLSADLM